MAKVPKADKDFTGNVGGKSTGASGIARRIDESKEKLENYHKRRKELQEQEKKQNEKLYKDKEDQLNELNKKTEELTESEKARQKELEKEIKLLKELVEDTKKFRKETKELEELWERISIEIEELEKKGDKLNEQEKERLELLKKSQKEYEEQYKARTLAQEQQDNLLESTKKQTEEFESQNRELASLLKKFDLQNKRTISQLNSQRSITAEVARANAIAPSTAETNERIRASISSTSLGYVSIAESIQSQVKSGQLTATQAEEYLRKIKDMDSLGKSVSAEIVKQNALLASGKTNRLAAAEAVKDQYEKYEAYVQSLRTSDSVDQKILANAEEHLKLLQKQAKAAEAQLAIQKGIANAVDNFNVPILQEGAKAFQMIANADWKGLKVGMVAIGAALGTAAVTYFDTLQDTQQTIKANYEIESKSLELKDQLLSIDNQRNFLTSRIGKQGLDQIGHGQQLLAVGKDKVKLSKEDLEVSKQSIELMTSQISYDYEHYKNEQKLAALQNQTSVLNQGANLELQKIQAEITSQVKKTNLEFKIGSRSALFGKGIGSVKYSGDQLSLMGLNAESLATEMATIGKITGKMPTADMAADMAMVAKRTGMSGEGLASLVESFGVVDGLSEKTSLNMVEGMRAMAEQAGIPLDNLMQETADAQKSMLSYGVKTTAQLTKQVAYAQSMGLSFSKIAEAGKSMVMNYQDSIKAEMELSALLGEQVDLSEVRAAFAAGDQEGALKALQAQGLNPDEMNMFQMEALQKSLGGQFDTSELQKMLKGGPGKSVGDLGVGDAAKENKKLIAQKTSERSEQKIGEAIIDTETTIVQAKLDKEIGDAFVKSEGWVKYEQGQLDIQAAQANLNKIQEQTLLSLPAKIANETAKAQLEQRRSIGEALMPALGAVGGAVAGQMTGWLASKAGPAIQDGLGKLAGKVKGFFGFGGATATAKAEEPPTLNEEQKSQAEAVEVGTTNALQPLRASPSLRVTVDKFKTEALKQLLGLQSGNIIEMKSDKEKQESIVSQAVNAVPGGEAISSVLSGEQSPLEAGAAALGVPTSIGSAAESLGVPTSIGGAAESLGVPTDVGSAAEKLGIPTDTGAVMEKAEEQVSKISSLGDKIKDVGKGIGSLLKSLGKGFGEFFSGVMKGIASGLKFFADPMVVLGAGGLAASITLIGAGLAGAAWIMGKALPTLAEGLLAFNNVNGDNLADVGLGVAALGAGMIAMGVGGVFMGIGNLVGMLGSKGQLPIEQLQELSKVDIDAEKVKNNATAVAYYGLAMSALGAASGLGGLGNAIGAVAGAITSLFGGPSMSEQFQKMREFSTYEIDAAKVKNNSEAVVAYSLAMAALGGGAAASGLGAAVGAIGNAVASFFGAEFDINKHFQEMQKFAAQSVDAEAVKNNSEAVVAYAKAMASLGGAAAAGGLGAAVGAIGNAVAKFFGGGTNVSAQMLEMQKFSVIDVDKEKVKNNAEAFVIFGKAMSEYKGTGEGFWSKLGEGIASFFSGGETDLIGQFERFSKINASGIVAVSDAIGSMQKAISSYSGVPVSEVGEKLRVFLNTTSGWQQSSGIANGFNQIASALGNLKTKIIELSAVSPLMAIIGTSIQSMVAGLSTIKSLQSITETLEDIPWKSMALYAAASDGKTTTIQVSAGAPAAAGSKNTTEDVVKQLVVLNANTKTMVKLTKVLAQLAAAEFEGRTSVNLNLDGKTIAYSVERAKSERKGLKTDTYSEFVK